MLVQVKFAKVVTLQFIRLVDYGHVFWRNNQNTKIILQVNLVMVNLVNLRYYQAKDENH